MASDALKKLQASLKEQDKGRNGGSRYSGGDNASYAFWNIPEGQSATLRFLPDKDQDNITFWRKRLTFKLQFSGVVGGQYPTSAPVTVTVPCMEMWGETCPILREVRPWWKEGGKEELARQYWTKKSYIYQGFVVNSPFEEENKPESPIRRFLINPSIHEIIENSLKNPEFEDMPTDFVGGRDFVVRKTKKDKYANYGTSQWSFKTRTLSQAEQDAIGEHGLYDLKEFLGRKPDSDEVDAIRALFHDSLEGNPFDAEAYGKWYRPFGSRNEDGESRVAASPPPAAPRAAPVATRTVAVPVAPAATPADDEDESVVEAEAQDAAPAAPASNSSRDTNAILARLRKQAGR